MQEENIGLKRTINDLDNEKLTENLCGFKQCNEYWISKIKEKIEELKNEKEETYTRFLASDRSNEELSTKGKMLEGSIQVLQEMLEEE